jgi:PAS domain S-box-containing protein
MLALSPERTLSRKLRHDAETRLKKGAAPATIGWVVGTNALSLLYELASDPARGADATKLLHELQVHQVELDMQHEQTLATERELTEDLARYAALYDHAPVAYLSVSPQRDILTCNIAAASLLGVARDKLPGRSIEKFLPPASRTTLLQLLKRLRPDGARESAVVQVKTAEGPCELQITASVTPGGRSFLVVLNDFIERP